MIARTSCLLLIAAALTGCATRPPAADGLPDDFAVSVSLAAPGEGDLVPGWYVLEADGHLRAATGERLTTSPVPPVVRTLSRADMAEVWSLTKNAGVMSNPPPGTPCGDQPSDHPGSAVVYAAGERHRRTIRVDAPGENPSIRALVSRLRELAWATPR